MTRAELMKKVMSEATGMPAFAFDDAIKEMRKRFPVGRLDEPMSRAETAYWLRILRNDFNGIGNWILKGAILAQQRAGRRAN